MAQDHQKKQQPQRQHSPSPLDPLLRDHPPQHTFSTAANHPSPQQLLTSYYGSSTAEASSSAPPPPTRFPLSTHHSHSSSFEADDERSATGPQSIPSTASYHSHHRPHRPSRTGSDSDASSDFHPGQPFRSAMATGGADDDEDHLGRHPPPSARNRRRLGGASSFYAGEDTRPTSKREILGWYMYAFASETYVICAIASFIPILLESLARENGVLLSDRTTPCSASDAPSSVTSSSAAALFPRSSASTQCVVYILGIEVNTASFAMYTFSISVLLQALLVVSISCAADHGNYRKTLLLAFAWTGSFAVMLYLAVSSHVYILGALLAIISNTSFGASFVLLNSFLPLLVRHHPLLIFSVRGGGDDRRTSAEVRPHQIQMRDEEGHDDEHTDGDDDPRGFSHDSDREVGNLADESTTALLPSSNSASGPSPSSYSPPHRSHEEQTSLELSISTQISSKGIGIGYCAALFVQCFSIIIVFLMHNTVWSQRVVLFVIGVWWAIFTIPAAMWLRPRPGPPLPASAGASGGSGSGSSSRAWAVIRSWAAYLVFAWSSLFRTISLARRLVDIVLFLAGWFLLSDAIATTSSTAVLFAKTQLHMEVWALGLINVISTLTGVIGAFSWAYVSRRFGLKPLHTILACLALFELIPIYGLMGYLPFVRRWGVGGLQQPWEMYPLAAVYGLVLGGVGSYCRSLYGELIPPGSEAAFYALYAITDKGSSVFGPAIVGAIIDASGEIRPAFWFLAALVGLPAPLLYFVNVERGKFEGEQLAAFIEGYRSGVEGSSADLDNDTDSNHTPRAILADYDDDR